MGAIKREERIGGQRLLLGNCLEIMAELNGVDHVISDPPYEESTHKNIGGITRKDGVKPSEKLNFESIDDIRWDVVKACENISNGWVLLFCTTEGVGRWADYINESKIKYKRACVWVKPDAMPQLNGQWPANGVECMVSAWNGKGHAKWNAGGKRGVYTHCVNTNRYGGHPTEKPLPLMMEILKDFTNHGQTVLDPFCGSGTTLVACEKMGRNGVGVEINPEYFEIACKRVDEAARQPDMFVSAPVAASKQEELF